MNTILAFVLVFGALVFFHELGHLILAKRAGILCREFAIGMGPKVFSFRKNETLYTIRLLPIGGYVRMAGEDPEIVEIKKGQRVALELDETNKVKKVIIDHFEKYPKATVIEVLQYDFEHELHIVGFPYGEEETVSFSVDEKAMIVTKGDETQIAPYNRQFASKTVWQRTKTIIAGPLANFILAFVLFLVIALIQGMPVDEAKLGKLTTDGAAKIAGLQENDQIISIDNKEVSTWSGVVQIVKSNPDKELSFLIERNGEERTVLVTPESVKENDKTVGKIGVYSPIEKSVTGSIKYGFTETLRMTKEIVLGVWKLVSGEFSIDMLSGPVGIYEYTGEVAQTGFYNLLYWGGILSINLGIVNLLPLPALDGGRLLFFAVEAVRGKPIDRHKEGMVHFIGFAFLMVLMLVVTWNDIKRLFM